MSAVLTDEVVTARPLLDPEGLRFSRLKLFAESPMHYLANVNGRSPTLDKGTAVHSILLGGQRVIYYDGKVKPTKDNPNPTKIGPRNGAQWEEFKAKNSDAKILALDEYETAHRIADAVRSNELAMMALTGVQEQTLRFEWQGLQARTTPDCRANDHTFVTELKTCRSSRPGRFSTQAFWMYYHAQMAFHIEGMKANGLVKRGQMPTAYIVAVCSAEPYPVTVFKLTDKALEQGRKSLILWTEQLRGCIESRHFPAYSQAIVDLDVPEGDELVFADGETESVEVPF